jgi:hypothetical protein
VELDVGRLEALRRDGRTTEAAALVAGEFLEGFSIPDARTFEDWLSAERRHWRANSVALLVAEGESQLRGGRADPAAHLAHRALVLDPLSDSATRLLMVSLAIGGDPAAALLRYREFAEVLQREVGSEPALETRGLADRLRAERTVRPPLRPGPPRVDTRRTPLVGREAELAALFDLWNHTVSANRAAAAVIEGDPGTGKSRLLEEVQSRARFGDRSAVTAFTRGVEADRDTPWSGALGLARGGLLAAPGLASASPAALASFAAEIPEWADRFGRPESAGTAITPGRALAEVLSAIALERPILLVVDDAHRLDRESLLALVAALRDCRAASLLVLFSVSANAPRGEIDELRATLGHDLPGITLRLEALPVPAIREICAWALPGYSPIELDRLSRRVAIDSAGLPLLAVEVIHAVASGFDLHADRGAWPAPLRTLDETMPGDLPDAVVAAIRVGFRRQSEPARQVLVVASVAGGRIGVEALARGTELDLPTLHQALDELEWHRWLWSDPRGYSFVARIAQLVIDRDLVRPGQRRRIRDRIAADSAG